MVRLCSHPSNLVRSGVEEVGGLSIGKIGYNYQWHTVVIREEQWRRLQCNLLESMLKAPKGDVLLESLAAVLGLCSVKISISMQLNLFPPAPVAVHPAARRRDSRGGGRRTDGSIQT